MVSERNIEPPKKHDAFWHLQAIGLLQPSPDPLSPTAERKESPVWGKLSGHEALVAIIDTGVSDHPYLKGRLEPPYNIDLTAAPALTLPDQKADNGVFAGMDAAWLATIGLYPSSQSAVPPSKIEKTLKDLVEKYEKKLTFDFGAPSASNQKFAAHGTSCAGLVAASSEPLSGKPASFRPYYRGVDPFSKLMSITTSFSPSPELLTLAFLLAAKKSADVILFPRGLPREILRDESILEPDWLALKRTILEVSKIIPVICASGNECDEKPIAPGQFAAGDNGIIAVAAVNYFGVRSSYSNFGAGVSVAAPSDDAEMFNQDQARLDKTDRFYDEHPYQAFASYFNLSPYEYGKPSVRAIDVPGPFGFSDASSGAREQTDEAQLANDPESFFTDFGGTSAAASIVAGVAALIQRARKQANNGKAFNGVQVRKAITQTARGENAPLLHLPGSKLTTDRVNGADVKFEQAFGKGLIAADLAVEKVLTGWTP